MHDLTYSASRAVLVGAGTFTTLDDLPAVRANIPGLKALLGDPVLHLSAESCTTLMDPASTREVSAAVRTAAQEATHTLLVYYAGHGLIDPGTGLLHLAVPDSDRDSVFDTAVPYEWIKRSIETSPAARRIVILDCCYSARAFGVQSESVAALAEIDGTYLIAAAAETAVALSPPGEPYTAFTAEFLDLLRSGVSSPAEFLDLDTVFDQLTRRLQAKDRPRPQSLCRNSLGSWPFARNNAYQPAPDGETAVLDVARALDATRTVSAAVLVAQIGELSEHRPATVAEMVQTALQHRAVSDLVPLLVALYRSGHQRHVEAALPALVAARTIEENTDLLEGLLGTSAEDGVVELLRLSAELKSAADTARLATALIRAGLREHTTVLLSVFAVTRGIDDVLAMTGLACGDELDGPLDDVMRTIAEHRPIADVITLFQDLYRAPHPLHALDLITSAARCRTATDTAEMITSLYRDGYERIAEDIFHTGIGDRGPEHTAELIAVLQVLRLTEAAALGRRLAVRAGTVADISQLITHLQAVGQHQHALAAALEAARLRSGAEFVEISRALEVFSNRQGLPALLDEAVRISSPDDVAHLIRVLDEEGLSDDAAQVFWDTVRDRPPGHAGRMLNHLHREGSRFTDEQTLRTLWRARTPIDIAFLARALDTGLPGKVGLVCDIDDRSVTDVAALIAALETLSVGILANRVLDAVVHDWDHHRQAHLVIALEERSLTGCAQRLEQGARGSRTFTEALAGLRSAQKETVWQALTFWWPRDGWHGRTGRTHRTPSPHDHALYIVKDDDTVYSIAVRYGVRWAAIVEANDLPIPFTLRPGQQLRIPFQNDGNRFVPPEFPRRLVPGRTHPSARELQAALKQAGYMPTWVVDSDHYGVATSQAVARFNSEHRLSQNPHGRSDPVISHRGWDLLHRIAHGKRSHAYGITDDLDVPPRQIWSGTPGDDDQDQLEVELEVGPEFEESSADADQLPETMWYPP
ncbi:caspase, EACC1-associated type [Streptomyces sp. DSM 40750]|uniref:caspase, EACC1-associated type n=1 Tax=Streptomyces sp. DSM 40750 TaxID=2801030 RepID=UPI00214B9244|nr:LysM peptidoglycan-binding domain-containing protein [Streptomyces sp. DSM 40750]UUU18961.1 LysM peptidoglycan-binding domain-containing protein [Streptomyces sp. DSM 40750]UUU27697.1 LysM peptidoglycan-binding domain-containing protein [Streptomyces sp. DSM 40750]